MAQMKEALMKSMFIPAKYLNFNLTLLLLYIESYRNALKQRSRMLISFVIIQCLLACLLGASGQLRSMISTIKCALAPLRGEGEGGGICHSKGKKKGGQYKHHNLCTVGGSCLMFSHVFFPFSSILFFVINFFSFILSPPFY